MLVKQSLSDQLIIDCLRTHYGIPVETLTFLPLGADTDASVYKAEAQDRRSYFVKLKRGHHHDIGIAIVQLLHKVGIQQIIPPVKTIKGQPTQRIDDFTLIVYPFIEGKDGFTRTLTDEHWLTLGKTLRKIHEINLPSSIKERIRHEAYSPKWREVIRSLYPHIEATPIGDQIALKLLAFIKKNILTIKRLVNRAEQLAQILQNETPLFVLCHSDIHGGNVLIDDDETIYIVDWDDPIMAPKERDLMFIGGGVANVWNKPHEEALFYKGYEKVAVNITLLAYYRHERIVEDIAIYGQDLLLSTAGGENRLEMYQHFIDMFEPRGVIDIAFKTYDGLGHI
ncbi:MAG: phosphotransferase [Tatlockia sp.]|nr:phosphotransferase [Tatlockia sp.]